MIADRNWIREIPEIEVIPMLRWKREMRYDETGLPWLPPSPNIPDLETAIVYPATVLIEATNVSEGRGTDRPFRQIGAPWLDGHRLAEAMNLRHLPGVTFSAVSFTPRSIAGAAPNPKHLGEECYGVELIVTDRSLFRPIETGIWLLWEISALGAEKLEIKQSGMNRLFGSDALSSCLRDRTEPSILIEEMKRMEERFKELSHHYFLY